jgi:sugar lactone lactonase YvrE
VTSSLRHAVVVACAVAVVFASVLAGPVAAYVPQPGDIVIADAAGFGGCQVILFSVGGCGGLIVVDPRSGEQTVVSHNTPLLGEEFVDPVGVALLADGRLVVADVSAGDDDSGEIIAVDPRSGRQTVIASNAIGSHGYFVDPVGVVAASDGRLYVLDQRAFGGHGGVIAVDVATGEQTPIASNAIGAVHDFDIPTGIAVTPGGRLLVSDEAAFDGNGGVIAVDPATGQQTPVASDLIGSEHDFASPLGIALEADGQILIVDSKAFDGRGGVVRVDPDSGAQTAVANNEIGTAADFRLPTALTVASNGTIDVTDTQAFGQGGGVIAVDPATGQQSEVASNAIGGVHDFAYPDGIKAYPVPAQGPTGAPPTGSTGPGTDGTSASPPLQASSTSSTSQHLPAPLDARAVLAGAQGCVDTRKFTFRLHRSGGTPIVRVHVRITGRSSLTRTGANITTLTIRHLPAGRFTVRIAAISQAGQSLQTRRTYRGCRKSRARGRHTRASRR